MEKKALIIGGGIAGITAARALAARGWRVMLLEKENALAQGASGNPAGVLFPRVSKQWNPATQFYWTAYAFMLRQLACWRAAGLDIPGKQCGMLYSPPIEKKRRQLREHALGLPPEVLRWVEAEEASALTGLPLSEDGLWFGQGSWVDVRALCEVLVQHPNITVQCGVEVTGLEAFTHPLPNPPPKRGRGVGTCWRARYMNGGSFEADIVVLANAAAARQLPQAAHLRLAQNRGQVTFLPEEAVTSPLRAIYCRRGYVLPSHKGMYTLGATYDHDDLDCGLRPADHTENIQQLQDTAPGWIRQVPERLDGRAALRTTTPQRLPYIGCIAEGLYVTLGHGSRGLLSAPLAAKKFSPLPNPVSAIVKCSVSLKRSGKPLPCKKT